MNGFPGFGEGGEGGTSMMFGHEFTGECVASCGKIEEEIGSGVDVIYYADNMNMLCVKSCPELYYGYFDNNTQ